MNARSAAGCIEASGTLGIIHQRLFDLLAGLPSATRSLLEQALLPAAARSARPNPTCRNDFYWLLIPEWLADDADPALPDLLWAQYCVYSLFRAQDDVIDGDAPDPHLAAASNVLLGEAVGSLQRHLPTSGPFWSWFQSAIGDTSTALIEIDRRQLDSARDGSLDLPLYAQLSRALTIASRALAIRRSNVHWHLLLPVLDGLAVAGQMLDDFHDVRSDLRQGRCNYFAWELTRPICAASAEATEAIIASNLATSDRAERFFSRVDGVLSETARHAAEFSSPEIDDYVARFRRTVSRLDANLTRRRLQLIPGADEPSGAHPPSYTAVTAYRHSGRA